MCHQLPTHMSEKRPLNVGVHGMGWAAGAHINTLKQVAGARVTAACSRRELDGTKLQNEFGIEITPYQHYEEMLANPDIDIIDICSPHKFHAEQAIAAANAGKDIILEKPIALTWDEALELRNAVLDNGVRVCVCFEVRFSEQADTLRSTLDESLIGDVHYAEVDYHHGIGPESHLFSWNVREDWGGSSLLTAGCHALDLLLYYIDQPVEEVTSYSTKTSREGFEPYEYDTTSVTLLSFADGTIGKVASIIDCVQPYYFRMQLTGSCGTVIDDEFYSEKIDGLDSDRWSHFATQLVDSADVEDHPYLPQFQDFVDSLHQNKTMSRTDFETGFESHRVIFAADRSAKEGRPVQMSEFEI